MINARIRCNCPIGDNYGKSGVVIKSISEVNYRKGILHPIWLVRFDDGIEVEYQEHWLYILEKPDEEEKTTRENQWFDDLNAEYKG